jgi:RIO-like serine/threonine protein kinase
VEHALQHLVDDGLLAPQPLEPMAHVMSGSIIQAGQAIAAADDPAAARALYGTALATMAQALTRGAG